MEDLGECFLRPQGWGNGLEGEFLYHSHIHEQIAFLVVSFSLRSRWVNLGIRGQGGGA